jgi:hypothetical protein
MTTTKERPIIFCGEMVRAIFAGRKTQTRHLIWRDGEPDHHMPWWCRDHWQDGDELLSCRYGATGDQLWVRETWAPRLDVDPFEEPEKARDYALYRADGTSLDEPHWHSYPQRWSPSIHMPRWASRIDLKITDVRAERLHKITEEDAIAEGILDGRYDPGIADGGKPGWCYAPGRYAGTPQHGFELLWDSINGKRFGCDWGSNPWVWVITFKRAEPQG